MKTSKRKPRLKKTALIVAVIMGIYCLSFLALLTLNPIDSGGFEKKGTLDYLFETAIFLFGIPVGGALLVLYGAHIALKGGWEGLVPAELVGVICWLGGVALVLSFPIIVLTDKSFSEINILYGVLSLTVVLPVAFLTMILHGGSELVQKDRFGRWLKSLRAALNNKVFEAE